MDGIATNGRPKPCIELCRTKARLLASLVVTPDHVDCNRSLSQAALYNENHVGNRCKELLYFKKIV